VVWDPDNECEIVLLTNLLEFGATTIAAIYKERWKSELFFKALKQNLTVKTFVGTSENALRIQIWTALNRAFAFEVVAPSFQGQLVFVQPGLDAASEPLYLPRELTKWLHDPMETPPLVPSTEQLTLVLV
jgi:hypothetical protein